MSIRSNNYFKTLNNSPVSFFTSQSKSDNRKDLAKAELLSRLNTVLEGT